jgi:hypothetical protein
VDLYIDRQNLARAGARVRGRLMYDYQLRQSSDFSSSSYSSSVFDAEYDCENDSFRVLSAVNFAAPKGEGLALEMVSVADNDFQVVIPDSPAAKVMRVACATK